MSLPTQTLFSVSEVDLVYRNKINPVDRPKVTTSSAAYDILLQCWDMNKIELLEQFAILLLDRSKNCLGVSYVSTGSVSACIVDPKVIFATALNARASSLILAHNHPSGNLTPSKADEFLTNKLLQGGYILDISVVDHLIVTPRSYYSFSDDGALTPF
ncbi:MAG TPA: JAB domain-containing protein [Saprospiraceae bacterium]|nr:JAB domain-containing protein [Saprospiraceae bacterium]